jgi:hypothetical protein
VADRLRGLVNTLYKVVVGKWPDLMKLAARGFSLRSLSYPLESF